jgi:HEAT repeat protein
VLTAGACLLVHSCLAASEIEVKQDKNALASPASLVGSLDSTNAATRFYAVDSLGKIGGSETIGPLVKALHDPDACVRLAAAKALGHSTNPTAISSLIDILKTEEDADVWNMAAKPLVDTGRSAIPAILAVFLKAEGLEVRASIGRALSQLG